LQGEISDDGGSTPIAMGEISDDDSSTTIVIGALWDTEATSNYYDNGRTGHCYTSGFVEPWTTVAPNAPGNFEQSGGNIPASLASKGPVKRRRRDILHKGQSVSRTYTLSSQHLQDSQIPKRVPSSDKQISSRVRRKRDTSRNDCDAELRKRLLDFIEDKDGNK
jgi:hypothetical protein